MHPVNKLPVRILSRGFTAVRRGGGGRGGGRGRNFAFQKFWVSAYVNTLYYTVIKHKEVLRWLNEHQKSLSTLSRHIKYKISPKVRGRYFRVFGRCGRKNFLFSPNGRLSPTRHGGKSSAAAHHKRRILNILRCGFCRRQTPKK